MIYSASDGCLCKIFTNHSVMEKPAIGKPFLTAFLSLLLSTFFMACEGYRCATGRVVDKTTNKALEGVLCENLTGPQKIHTDSSGTFDLCNRISSCVPNCKDIQIRFSKSGYQTVTIENPEENVVIYLEK